MFQEILRLIAELRPQPPPRQRETVMPVVGFLDAGSAAERVQQVAAVRKGLSEGGYQEGQNVALEFRWAEGQYGRFGELAADLRQRDRRARGQGRDFDNPDRVRCGR